MNKHKALLQFLFVGWLALLLAQPGGGAARAAVPFSPAADEAPPAGPAPDGPVDLEAEGLVDAPASAAAAVPMRTFVVNLGQPGGAVGAASVLAAAGVSAAQAPGLAELGYAVIHVPEGQAAAAQAALAGQAGVLSVEESQQVFTTNTVPNDQHWGQQYGPQRIQGPQAWSITPGASSVIIAIVDTGIDLGHSDLSSKLWVNPGEVPGNGLDDDHNGFIDDVRGWDFHNWDNNPSDDHNPGHGTHVAGIAAAASNNNVGIAGMAWNARVMPLKVLAGNGSGSAWAVAEAVIYAAKRGAKVINLSLAGRNLGSYLRDAISFAHSRGALVVAAAGNEGGWGLMEPASFANAVGVVALDSNNQRAGYSNYGPEADFAAPGTGVFSTFRGGYGHMSGTSMAAPHVAGAAALLASMPGFNTPDRIIGALRLTAADSGDYGWDPYYGYGRIQVANALNVTFGTTTLPPCTRPTCYRVFLPVMP